MYICGYGSSVCILIPQSIVYFVLKSNVYAHRRGFCPGGLCPGGLCPGFGLAIGLGIGIVPSYGGP